MPKFKVKMEMIIEEETISATVVSFWDKLLRIWKSKEPLDSGLVIEEIKNP